MKANEWNSRLRIAEFNSKSSKSREISAFFQIKVFLIIADTKERRE